MKLEVDVHPTLTQTRLKSRLRYDPASGLFHWKEIKGWNKIKGGELAGYLDKFGRVKIRVDGKLYLAHRLAWLYVHGSWPPNDIDHKDGNSSNNRIGNLRKATRSENRQNLRRARCNSKTGFLGVSERKGGPNRWTAQITLRGKTKRIGFFPSPEKAHEAYLAEKVKLHPFQTLVQVKL